MDRIAQETATPAVGDTVRHINGGTVDHTVTEVQTHRAEPVVELDGRGITYPARTLTITARATR